MALAHNKNRDNFDKMSFDKMKDFLRQTDRPILEMELSDKLLALKYIENLEENLIEAKNKIKEYKEFFVKLKGFYGDEEENIKF
jgi:hypothetical protein